jgi:hypothetical protein
VRPYQISAGLLVGLVEIDDGYGDIRPISVTLIWVRSALS